MVILSAYEELYEAARDFCEFHDDPIGAVFSGARPIAAIPDMLPRLKVAVALVKATKEGKE